MAKSIAALLASKKEMLERVSYELRGPLARQQVVIDLLRDNRVKDKASHINRIEKENACLNELTHELLMLASLHTQ